MFGLGLLKTTGPSVKAFLLFFLFWWVVLSVFSFVLTLFAFGHAFGQPHTLDSTADSFARKARAQQLSMFVDITSLLKCGNCSFHNFSVTGLMLTKKWRRADKWLYNPRMIPENSLLKARMQRVLHMTKEHLKKWSKLMQVTYVPSIDDVTKQHNAGVAVVTADLRNLPKANVLRVTAKTRVPYLNNSLFSEVPLPNVTIVINTWRREECLKRLLSHWRQCSFVAGIVVVSSDPFTERRWANASMQLKFSGGVPVHLHSTALGNDKLTDRFLFDDSIMTDALFSVDDDLLFPCEVLYAAAKLWNALGQNTAISFFPRELHLSYVSESENQQKAVIDLKEAYAGEGKLAAWSRHYYNVGFVTMGGLMHRKYYDLYQSPRMEAIRRVVDGNVTAEDITMSLLYSSANGGVPPLLMLHGGNHVALGCEKQLSSRMHKSADRKRLQITVDAMKHLNLSSAETGLKHSSVFVWVDD